MGISTRLVFLACIVVSASCGLFGGDDTKSFAVDGGAGGLCETKDDCAAAFVCAGGACQTAGAIGLGGACWATRDCGEDLFCSPQGICAPAGSGVEGDVCATAAECDRGFVCEVFGFGGQCAAAGLGEIGGACAINAECLPGLVCGPEDTCGHPAVVYPPFTGVDCGPDENTFKAFFEVPTPDAPIADFYRLPFPNDARVAADGTVNLSDFPRPGQNALGIDIVDLYVDALVEDFSGFSGVAAVSFRFSRELDFGTVNGDTLQYIDISPDADRGNRQRSWGYDTGKRLYHCQHLLKVTGGAHEPLLPGHTYAVFFSNAVLSADQVPAVQDGDLTALLSATRPTGNPTLENAWDGYQLFRDYLGDAQINIDPATIAGATVFTVQDTTGRAARLATAVASSAAPELKDLTLCDGVNVSPCEDATGRGACSAPNDAYYEIHGRYTVPNYQQGTTPYETPADGGGIQEISGVPQQVNTQDVCFALTVPKGATPANGWPLNVYGHGTGGSFTSPMPSGIATALATATPPMAMFAFDGVVHGERRGSSTRDSNSLMFNVVNPRAARDNNLQGGVDVLQAFRVPGLGTITLPGAGDTSFDAANSFYMGHSQGSNVGMPVIASSDVTRAAIFSGAGSYLTQGIMTKTSPVNAKASLEYLIGEDLGTSHPVMVIWQTFFDSVDTLHYAPLLLRRPDTFASKHIFMSWGANDTFSPQPTLLLTARAAGLPVADPVIEDLNSGLVVRPFSANITGGDAVGRTAACFQYPADGFDGHFAAIRDPLAVADWLEFLTTAITAGTPAISAR